MRAGSAITGGEESETSDQTLPEGITHDLAGMWRGHGGGTETANCCDRAEEQELFLVGLSGWWGRTFIYILKLVK
ncbi:hypothetical protein EYF80_056100 [Liparis tanakae]|uniref:Uncharacterized protein n=1 Tax=Liparis tanakae TaxID=230148 RepID=A0A4Z2EYA1_9TELE|nr:hypothetical protein EYF80_056100 [Liparis tanakae]